MKKHFILLFSVLLGCVSLPNAQKSSIERVEPAFWWTGMENNQLQVLMYGDSLGFADASIKGEGISIDRQISVDSPNYLFVYLNLEDDLKPGKYPITLTRNGKTETFSYQIKERTPSKGQNGFSSKDVIYLMMPDRFANGNPENDSIEGMLEKADRNNPNARHGGDIQGVIENLDYIKNLGMTAIWFTPVFENDMTAEYGAYHGYAATDMYKIDRRFGTNQEFLQLVDECHNNGMKVIMDMIHNHVGDQHWWMKDQPTPDWFNSIEKYGTTNYRGAAASDPYASDYDHNKLTKGWFVTEMPDLNQKNPLVADYLIQNTIWWIEHSNIDGIRMDTYVYPDKDYMGRWAKEVLTQYPDFNIVGEAWVNTVAHESYWQEENKASFDDYNSYLPSVTDFPLEYAIRDAFTQPEGWLTGLKRPYYILAQDYLYTDPMKNVVFLDNHDLNRFYEQIGKDKEHFKMAYGFLMTTRGIPQVYYGTELMFDEPDGVRGDGAKRIDMPGGWPGDDRSVFTKEGRTETENEIHSYVTKLSNWRQTASAVHNGSYKHFLPTDGVYVYFRYNEDQTIMVVMNKNEEAATISREKHIELLRGYKWADDILREMTLDISGDFEVPGKTTTILELK